MHGIQIFGGAEIKLNNQTVYVLQLYSKFGINLFTKVEWFDESSLVKATKFKEFPSQFGEFYDKSVFYFFYYLRDWISMVDSAVFSDYLGARGENCGGFMVLYLHLAIRLLWNIKRTNGIWSGREKLFHFAIYLTFNSFPLKTMEWRPHHPFKVKERKPEIFRTKYWRNVIMIRTDRS